MTYKRIKKRKIGLLMIIISVFCAAYAGHRLEYQPQTEGHFRDKKLAEVSGIAASAVNTNVFYVHNDSGDTSRFFAVDADGNLKATYYFKGADSERLGVRDCEDIAVGPGPVANNSYVYLGDIGDNAHVRKYITIYRFSEPKLTTDSIARVNGDSLKLFYPDKPRDAETLMVDPVDRLLYIVSKREDSVGVYTAPLDFKNGDSVTLTRQCKLRFRGFGLFKYITAGDISADGTQILLKSYSAVYYWKREPGEPVWKAMQRKATELPYKTEKQGEAIGFTRDGKSYLTTSEGVYAPIYRYFLPVKQAAQ